MDFFLQSVRLRFVYATAWMVLGLEYAGRILWSALLITAFFLALAAFDILPRLPGWLHLLVLLGFIIAIASALIRQVRQTRRPRRETVLRRIELDNRLIHQPFSTLSDRQFIIRDGAAPLWRAHQLKAAQSVRRVKPILPRPFVAGVDRHAGRALAAILLLIGIVFSSNRFGERLDAALSPAVFGNMAARNVGLDAWITPPDYTGAPPVILSRGRDSGDSVEVPVNSVVEARVNGGWSIPRLGINDGKQSFEKTGPHNFQVTGILQSGDTLGITQGWHRLGKWSLSLLANVAPVITWVNPPAAGEHYSVKLNYTAADQYGLAKIEARIRLADEVKGQMLPKGTALDQPGADIFMLELPGQAGHPKSVKAAAEEDWASNPWAGFPVHVQLTATDLAGLTGTTTEEDLILPERAFTQPVAKAIIALRKRLTLDPLHERVDIAGKLGELASHYDDYGGDATIFLALRVAASRLRHDERLAELHNVQDILWEAAAQIEDGATSQSAKNLTAAEKALQEALERNASPQEIDKLTDQLKSALNKHLDQLEKELAKKFAQHEAVPPPGSQALTRNNLNDLVDKMQNSARNGDRKSAQDMLSQLENEMKNLHAQQNQPANGKSGKAWNDMGRLKKLIERQQQLMDKTFRRSTGNTAPEEEMHSYHHNPFDPRHRQLGDAEDNGADQQRHMKSDLQALEQELKDLGMKAPKMGEAATDMGAATDKLEQNNYTQALPLQQDALDKLRDDMKSMSQQMQDGGGMAGNEGPNGPGGAGKDPLGRPAGGNNPDEKVDIPDSSDQERARAVIEELRKRSGERDRAKAEHDYIDRLLKGF